MNQRTSTISDALPSPTRLLIITTLLLSSFIAATASASDSVLNILTNTESNCSVGFADTWIIGQACDIGGDTNIKTNDAIHIQCDSVTNRWSVDFYEEPANADPNVTSSQAVRHAVCPGNGYLAKALNNKLLLQCNYWDSNNNVTKQLEFELLPSNEPGVRGMNWLARDYDNPNVICGISGRPDDGSLGGTGNVISDD